MGSQKFFYKWLIITQKHCGMILSIQKNIIVLFLAKKIKIQQNFQQVIKIT